MTVAALTPSVAYVGDGVGTEFPLHFRFLDPQDIKVSRERFGDPLPLVYGVDYTAVGGETDAGGTLIASVAPDAGVTLHIWRDTPRSQNTDYTAGDRFPAEAHEEALDKARLIDQEQDVEIDRTLRAPVGGQGKSLLVSDSGIVGIFGGQFSVQPLFDIIQEATDLVDDGAWGGPFTSDGVWG